MIFNRRLLQAVSEAEAALNRVRDRFGEEGVRIVKEGAETSTYSIAQVAEWVLEYGLPGERDYAKRFGLGK